MKLNTDNKKDADEKLAASESVSDSAQAEQGGAQAEAAVKTKKKPEKRRKKRRLQKTIPAMKLPKPLKSLRKTYR